MKLKSGPSSHPHPRRIGTGSSQSRDAKNKHNAMPARARGVNENQNSMTAVQRKQASGSSTVSTRPWCTVCWFASPRIWQLRRHMQIISPNRPTIHSYPRTRLAQGSPSNASWFVRRAQGAILTAQSPPPGPTPHGQKKQLEMASRGQWTTTKSSLPTFRITKKRPCPSFFDYSRFCFSRGVCWCKELKRKLWWKHCASTKIAQPDASIFIDERSKSALLLIHY